MTIGQRIRQLRKSRGWSQSDLAHQMKTIQKQVSNWEIDVYEPHLSTIIKLCKVFGITLNEFMEGVDVI